LNLKELAHYFGDEEKSEQALIEKGILKWYGACPFCGEGRSPCCHTACHWESAEIFPSPIMSRISPNLLLNSTVFRYSWSRK